MKITILFSTLFIICFIAANGQTIKAKKRLNFFLSAGLAHADVYLPVYDQYDYRSKITFMFGPSVNYQLKDNLSLHGELLLLYSKFDLHSPNLNVFGTFLLPEVADYKQSVYLITLPLKLRYSLGYRFFISLGPSIDMQLDSESSKYSRWFGGIGLNGEFGFIIGNPQKSKFELAPKFYISNLISFQERPLVIDEPVEMHLLSLGIIGRYKF